MRFPRCIAWLSVVSLGLFLAGCLEQFDPTKNNAMFKKEMAQAATASPKLSATGELPPAGGPAIDIDEKYTTLCSGCHGAQGHGDGPAGMALNPKPRNFSDKAWQASVDDARITTVIKSGGAAVGLSPMMAPWGSVLSDAELKLMVGKVRSFNH